MKCSKKFTLGFLPTLLVLIAMLVAACGTSTNTSGTKAPKSQQHLRVAFSGGNDGGDISTFDPAQASDLYSSQSIQLVFTGLVGLNDKLQIEPQLAQSWSNSGTTWTFHLKPNLKFSDGTPLTADDVAYSINRALSGPVNNLSGGLAATYLGLIKDSAAFTAGGAGAPTTLIGDSIIVKDASTIQLILDHNTGYFLDALSYPTSWVVEKSLITKYGDTKWTDHLADNGGQGGDGPFKILSYSHATGIKFVPNPNYYGAQPALQEVDYNFYKTPDTEFKAYQANQVDLSAIPSALIPTQKPKLGTQYRQYPSLSIGYLALNYLAKPFDNIKIRQALELAINKDVINTSILNGVDIPTCHIVPAGMPGYNANLHCPGNAPTSGNPTLAKQLLQQGMQEEGITTLPQITLTYPNSNPTTEKEMTTIRQMWQQVLGVNIGASAIDFGTEIKQINQTLCATPATPQKCVNQGLQMWFIGWIADYPDPQDWTTLQFAKGAPNNALNYGENISANAAIQQQTQDGLAKADLMAAGTARFNAYNSLEQQLVNDCAWVSLTQGAGVQVVKPYVQGIFNNSQGLTPPEDWANIFITTH